MMHKEEFNPGETSEPENLPSGPAPIIDSPLPLWRLVLLLAIPWWIQHFLHLAVTLSDALLAGRYLHVAADQNVTSQAAQTTANYLMWFVSNFTTLVSVGATALVARFWGARDRAGANRAVHQALILAVVFGLAGSLVGLLFVTELMHLLQPHDAAAEQAAAYLRPILLALTLQMLEAVGIACLVGVGDTVAGMWVMSGVAVVNLPLAWLFLRGWWIIPELGFMGIATGTALSHALGCLAVLAMLARGRSGLRLSLPELRADFDLMRRLLWVSVPAGVDSLVLGIAQLWFLSVVNTLSEAAIAAHGIALRWEGLGYLTGNAFSVAAMALVGQNLGARRPERAAASGWTAFGLGCAAMCVMAVVFFLLAEPMFNLFCPKPEQRSIVEQGVPALQLIAFAMPMAAACFIFTGALRGAGDTRVPIVFTLIGFYAVRIPLAYAFVGPLEWGLLGAWWAMISDLTFRGGAFLLRFASGKWKWVKV
jgi:putative MATE family efflux protein